MNSYRAPRSGIRFLAELERFVWPRREVTVCFDADVTTNDNVRRALVALAEELLDRGAVPRLLILPSVYDDPERKTGLDDFLVARSAVDLRRLLDEESEHLTLARDLWRLNERWTWARDVQRVIELDTAAMVEPGPRLAASVTATCEERTLTPAGRVSFKKVNAAGKWVSWPLRREVDRVEYDPALPPLSVCAVPASEGRLGGHVYNLWPGWACEPQAGDVSPFMALLDHLFVGAGPGVRRYVERWLAYPLQHPGAKLKTSVVLYGLAQGTGKSLVGYTMGHIYGANFSEIDERDFHSDFNDWSANKQFVLGDDVSGSDRKQDRERLKKLITQKRMRVNIKYRPAYEIRDCINYLWTTNQPDAFMLEDDDRRFMIHEVVVEPLPPEFYEGYVAWLDAGGARAVFRYMLDLDLAGFGPGGRAPHTAAKDAMIRASANDAGAWVRTLRENPNFVLRVGDVPLPQDVISVDQLRSLYDPDGSKRISAVGMGREMARAGFRQANGGLPVRTPDGNLARYYVVRNHERWATAAHDAIVEHLMPGEAAGRRRKF